MDDDGWLTKAYSTIGKVFGRAESLKPLEAGGEDDLPGGSFVKNGGEYVRVSNDVSGERKLAEFLNDESFLTAGDDAGPVLGRQEAG